MHVVLVQPPDSAEADASGHVHERLAPPWDLLCLQAFLRARTGHHGHLVDARLFSHFEADFVAAVRRVPAPRILVVHARDVQIGEAMAVVETTHRHFPDTPIALCGPYASAHPASAVALPHVQFALAGDPEPILRSLLDFLHVPNRLRQTPGLAVRGGGGVAPAWLPDLAALPAPTWEGVAWTAYHTTVGGGLTGEMRLSRGHSGSAFDRAIGGADQPLRFWPMDRMAALLMRCAHKGVVEMEIADPPGVWTPDRIRAWCHALIRVHNTQPWSFQSPPRQFSAAEIETLIDAGCRRLALVLPSCDPDLLKRFECLHDRRRLKAAWQACRDAGLAVNLRLWVGGPEERRGERDRIARFVRALGFPGFVAQPFPFAFDAPLCREREPDGRTPTLEEWIAWSHEPWIKTRPVPAWGGADGADRTAATCAAVVQRVTRSPLHRLKRAVARWRGRSLIEDLEARMVALFHRPAPPPGQS